MPDPLIEELTLSHTHHRASDKSTGNPPVHDHTHHHADGHLHDHGHSHGHGHSHVGEVTADSEQRVFWAMLITLTFMVVEILTGLFSHSLALISDGIHMLSDTFSLGLALFAFRLSRRPSNARHSYGYQRIQVLAAFTNGLVLLLIGLWIVIEAIERLFSPENVAATPMLVVAIIGLIVNGVSFWILEGGEHDNINLKGAALHVMGDLLGSAAAIIAAIIIKLTGFNEADPLLSILACILILRSAYAVLRRSSHILLEGAPEKVVPADVRQALGSVKGVTGVHDLHLWSLTDNDILLTAHLVIAEEQVDNCVLQAAHQELAQRFGIEHATLQIEKAGQEDEGVCSHGLLHP